MQDARASHGDHDAPGTIGAALHLARVAARELAIALESARAARDAIPPRDRPASLDAALDGAHGIGTSLAAVHLALDHADRLAELAEAGQ
jgi:hypothetical protein